MTLSMLLIIHNDHADSVDSPVYLLQPREGCSYCLLKSMFISCVGHFDGDGGDVKIEQRNTGYLVVPFKSLLQLC